MALEESPRLSSLQESCCQTVMTHLHPDRLDSFLQHITLPTIPTMLLGVGLKLRLLHDKQINHMNAMVQVVLKMWPETVLRLSETGIPYTLFNFDDQRPSIVELFVSVISCFGSSLPKLNMLVADTFQVTDKYLDNLLKNKNHLEDCQHLKFQKNNQKEIIIQVWLSCYMPTPTYDEDLEGFYKTYQLRENTVCRIEPCALDLRIVSDLETEPNISRSANLKQLFRTIKNVSLSVNMWGLTFDTVALSGFIQNLLYLFTGKLKLEIVTFVAYAKLEEEFAAVLLACNDCVLNELKFGRCIMSDNDFKILGESFQVQNIKNLMLRECDMKAVGGGTIKGLLNKLAPTLEELDLSLSKLEEEAVGQLVEGLLNCKHLRNLDIPFNITRSADFSQLGNLPNLLVLDLGRLYSRQENNEVLLLQGKFNLLHQENHSHTNFVHVKYTYKGH